METKTELKSETIEQLQDLIRMNIDSSKGFREAADNVDSEFLKEKMLTIANERQAQATTLQNYVEMNDEDAREEGSYAAAMHRCWMNTRALFTSNDNYAILAEAERGEDHIKAAYEDTLKDIPGSAMNDVLMAQYTRVKEQHDLIRDMRDGLK